MSLPVLQLGRTVLCSWAEYTSEPRPPQLCWAQLPLRGTVELGACLDPSALCSRQTHFL